MSSDSPYSLALDAALAALAGYRPASLDERLIIDNAIAALFRAKAIVGAALATPLAILSDDATMAAPPATLKAAAAPQSNLYYGMGLGEACVKCILLAGTSLAPRDIWATLESAGFQSAHDDPISAVARVLPRRAKTHGDVLLVGKGRWNLKAQYNEQDLVAIKKGLGGMAGRDHAKHVEKTKQGMNIARARGAKLGQPYKLTESLAREIKRLMADGKRIREVSDAVGLSYSTIRNYWPIVEAWQEGDELSLVRRRLGEDGAAVHRTGPNGRQVN